MYSLSFLIKIGAPDYKQTLQFIMELLYWLLEGGDSEDREVGLLLTLQLSQGFRWSGGLRIILDLFDSTVDLRNFLGSAQSSCKGHGKIQGLKWFKCFGCSYL